MPTLDGCVVKEAFRHPSSKDIVALRAVWSGGQWSPGTSVMLRQQRDQSLIGSWTIVGVEKTCNSIDPLILLRPSQKHLEVRPGDIFLLGSEVVSTALRLVSTDIPQNKDCSVQFGVAKFHGVLLFVDGNVQSLVLFHRPDATLFRFEEQPIFWRGRQYRAHIRLDDDSVFLNLSLTSEDVKVKSLLDVLASLRGFTLDAGQQLLYQHRAVRKRRLVYDFFEPSLQVAAGSVVVKVLPGTPRQLPLVMRASDPLRLLVDSISEGLVGSVQGVILTLSSRVASTESLLGHLRDFARASIKSGGVVVTLTEEGETFQVDHRFLDTIENALSSLQWREVSRRGVMYAVETGQRWFRIAVQGTTAPEHWTINFGQEWSAKIEGRVVPRMVEIVFETTAPESTTSGRGSLIDFRDI